MIERPFLSSSGLQFSRVDILQRSSLRNFNSTSPEILIPQLEASEEIQCFLSALIHKKRAVFSPNSAANSLSWTQSLEAAPPLFELVDLMREDSEVLGFSTSGSTGQRKILWKAWKNILSELDVLKSILNISASDHFISLVPPHHLFGFLYSLLLPWLTGASVEYRKVSESLDFHSGESAEIIIFVPSLWPLAKSLISSETRFIISSGAQLPSRVETEFLELKAERGFQTKLYEMLGSTETGGLGYREVGQTESRVFQAFPQVEFFVANEKTFIRSGFVADSLQNSDGLYELEDQIELLNGEAEGSFRHLGRKDRLIKYSGQRYSLNEIERNLKKALKAREVLCGFKPDESHSKGGHLMALVERDSDVGLADRSAYLGLYSTPYPDRLECRERLARDSMGKLSRGDLMAFLREAGA